MKIGKNIVDAVQLKDPGQSQFALHRTQSCTQPVWVVVTLRDQELVGMLNDGEGYSHTIERRIAANSEVAALQQTLPSLRRSEVTLALRLHPVEPPGARLSCVNR